MKIQKHLKYTNIYTIMFVLISVAFTLLIVFFVSLNHANLQKTEYKIVSSLEIEDKKELTHDFYTYFENFLSYIYKNKNFMAYLNDNKESDRDNIAQLFMTIAGSNKEITQLRYIDEQGQEAIRVDRDKLDGDIYLIEREKFQNKKHRYYFINTMKKNNAKFELSKLDLNVENNKIEVPHKPVLRFSIPVYLEDKPKGILIVNVFAQKLLNKLLYSQQFNVDIYDQDKHILVSSLNNNWSRYLNEKPNLNEEDFVAKQRLIKTKNGESLFIGLTPKSKHNYSMYLNKSMLMLMVLVIAISILIAFYLAKIPQKLVRKLAIKDNTINKNIILSTTDKNGVITDVSEAFCKHSGYLKKELIGKRHSILKHPSTKKEIFENLWNTIKNKKTWHSQIQTVLKDNRECWIDIKIMPEYDENDKLIGYMSIREDITDQKENIRLLEENSKLLETKQDALILENEVLLDNEQGLLQALEDFEIFFNTMPTPYIVVASDLNMRLWNHTAQTIFNLKRLSQIEIRPLTVITKNLSHIDFVNYLNDATHRDKPYKVEMCLEDKSLKFFNVQAIEHPTDKSSFILSFNAIGHL